jgi:hypothetical protein
MRLSLQDLESQDRESRSRIKCLEDNLLEVKQALAAASSVADSRCNSVAAQLQMQMEKKISEQQLLHGSLQTQIKTLQKHILDMTSQLQQAKVQLEEEKQARSNDQNQFQRDFGRQQELSAAADSKAASNSTLMQCQEHELQALHLQVQRNGRGKWPRICSMGPVLGSR